MSSLPEVEARIKALDQQIDQVRTKLSYHDVRLIEMSISRTLDLLQRFTGDKTVDGCIARLQGMIMTVRSLQAAYTALQIARMSAGDPIAWASAITMGISTGISTVSFLQGY